MNENSYSKNENSNESENIKLPLIDMKLIPSQKNINDVSKNENDDDNKLKYIKSQTILTSKKTETERFENVKSKNIINNEAISDLLKEKIEINNSLQNDDSIYKSFLKSNKKKEINKKKKINRYINEDILQNSPIRINKNKKLKNIKISNLFTVVDEDDKSKNDDDSNFDKTLYNLRLYNFIKENNEAKRIKSVMKRKIEKKESKYFKSDWRKNINCSLDYKYALNRLTIKGLNSLINSMSKKSELYFDVFKTESNEMLQQIWST